MGAPKLKTFPKKAKNKLERLNKIDKQDIELLKQHISEKIKNPDFAKKAAKILEEMIRQKSISSD